MQAPSLSPEQSIYLRLRAQGLVPAPAGIGERVDRTVQHMFGIQAQEAPSSALAIWARNKGVSASQVEAARLKERSIVRTWGFRGTLYLLASDDLYWLLPVLGPVFIRKSLRRYKQLGLSEEVCARANREIVNLLAGQGAMTRAGIVEHLESLGIPVEGQSAYHLIRHAGLQGAICFGPEIEGQPTFVALAEWLPPPKGSLNDKDVHAALVKRYLRSHAPAQMEDIVSWTGLSMGAIKSGIKQAQDDLLEVAIDDSQAWMLADQADWLGEHLSSEPLVSLLPAYDPYLLGYRRRDLIVPARFARRIHPGGGFLRPTVIQNGIAIATWKLRSMPDGLEFVVDPFGRLEDVTMVALGGEVEALGSFYGSRSITSIIREVENE